MVIHPGQVAAVNRIYATTDEDIARSRRIVAAFEEAAAANRGAVSVDGVMVDAAMARRARAILDEVDASK